MNRISLKSPALIFLLLAMIASPCAALQTAQTAPATGGDLNAVLSKMNTNAATFKSAQADFEFETYQKVVDEKDVQKGRIYFRRDPKGVEAAFNLTFPAPKQVVFKDGMLNMYEPKIDQLTERDVSKNKAEVESFLSLGFGARGDDLKKSYDVTLGGWETIDGVKTARLELVPKDEKTRNTYNKIILWIDPERDILLQQKFFEPSGDNRTARYTNMKLNAKLPDDVFRIKTSAHTRVVRP